MCNCMKDSEDSPPGFLAVDNTQRLAALSAGEAHYA